MQPQTELHSITPKNESYPVSPEQVLEWLAFAGNDEAALITLLAVSRANEPIGQTALFRELQALCEPFALDGELKRPRAYCEHSLTPIGVVEPVPITVLSSQGRLIPGTGFQLNTKNKESLVGFSGSLLKWSLDNPELSLGILGKTASATNDRAPLVRFWTLYELVTRPDGTKDPTISQLSNALNIPAGSISINALRLAQKRVVQIDSFRENDDRKFMLLRPDPISESYATSSETIDPTTDLFLRSVKHAYSVKDVWSIDEFLAEAGSEFGLSDDELIKLRRRFDDVFRSRIKYLEGVILPPDKDMQRFKGPETRISLSPEHAAAISNLIGIVNAFCDQEPSAISQGIADAEKILDSPEAVAKLYNKSLKEHTKGITSTTFEAQTLRLIKSLGNTATIRELRDAYAADTGDDVTDQFIRTRLKDLLEGKVISVKKRYLKPGAQLTNVYSAIDASSKDPEN